MSWHAILLCEGAHDFFTVAAMVQRLHGWGFVKNIPQVLPEALRRTHPTPNEKRIGAPEFDPQPKYFRTGDRWIEVRQRGSVSALFNETTVELLKMMKPDAIAIIVDANDVGVTKRVEDFRKLFGPIYPHAAKMDPGDICSGAPSVGLWVAPDNKSNGTILDPILEVAAKVKPKLKSVAEKFVDKCEKFEPGPWTKHRSKAILGAIGQTVEPGTSLRVALRDCTWLYDGDLLKTGPMAPLMQFLRDVSKA